MKNIKYGVLLLSLFVVAGCEESEDKKVNKDDVVLSCILNKEDEMMNFNHSMKITYKYDKKEIKSVEMITDTDYKKDVGATNEDVQKDCDDYSGEKGVTCSVSLKDNKYYSVIKYDLDKVTDEFLEKDGFYEATYKDFKEAFEGEGYICK